MPDTTNIATDLPKEVRTAIAAKVIQGYRTDLESRRPWEEKRDRWFKLSQCQPLDREVPWEGASNVCVPILASASHQFQARAYASLFDQPYPERLKAIAVEASDITRARKVEQFMNWQLIVEMREYETEWDRMLMELPIMGTAFKKTYWDSSLKRPVSVYVPAVDVLLPYRTPSLERARRITQRRYEHLDEVKALGRRGFYGFTDGLKEGSTAPEESSIISQTADELVGEESNQTTEAPNIVLECHTEYELKGDSEPKPYIFWVDLANGELLRATSREVKVGGKTHVLNQWTDYHFVPNPEGLYSFGFGHYLEPLNEIANTVFNQFINAGMLANTPFAFYGRGAGLKSRKIRLAPGKSVQVNDVSQVQLAKYPGLDQSLPTMLQMINRFSQDITSNTEEIQGRAQQGVREPTVGGTMARIEQGLVTFGVLTKRVLRQQAVELRQIFALNSLFLPQSKQFRVLGSTHEVPFSEVKREDFTGHLDIIPTGNPAFASQGQRRAEAAEVMQVALNHPMLVGNPQTGEGLNAPAQIAFLRDYLGTFAKADLARYLPEVPEPPVAPEVENAMFMQGDRPQPKQGEAHAEHLTSHLEFMQTKAYKEMGSEHQAALRDHMDRTEVLAALESRAQEQGGAGGQGITG